MYNWQKKGLIFDPSNRFEWMKEFAQVPTPVILGETYRVFFTTRHYPGDDNLPVSNIGYIDVSRENPDKILRVSETPILALGAPGAFDEFGLMPADIVHLGGERYYLYFTGWTRSASVPYTTAIGLAVSEDRCQTFKKITTGPILGQNKYDPVLVNGPSVVKREGAFHMFYSSATQWIEHEGKKEVFYFIKHATSNNGIDWVTEDLFCLEPVLENEVQNAPRVCKVGDIYHMWFCYRKVVGFRDSVEAGYRLGLAVSQDLRTWTRMGDGELGITKSEKGWDCEMMCYPYLLQDNDVIRLFYNGNSFGKKGFGYAEMPLK